MNRRRTNKKMAHRLAKASLLAAIFLPMPSQAASSAWVTSPGGAFRLVASQPRPDGSIPAILEVKLEPGWKTYWRDPGASGIPPQITFDPSGGVALEAIRFPAPKTFSEGPGRYVGYDSSVAFPLVLKRVGDEKDLAVRASVFLGVCEEICIPVQGTLDLTLKSGDFDNPLDGARIEKAVASLPEAPSDDFRITKSAFDEEAGIIRLDLRLPQDAGKPEIFLAGPAGFSFGPPVVADRGGAERRVDVPVKLSGKDRKIAGKPIALTVRAGDRSMETTLAFD
ncbi:protein-disulfide reductase DsbD domain-containing protein [Sinorhizobium fredii]|uniref:protein-disulfide reductase DsbD domain-containing protein n=1 Tax=Rhizobium fredii TaxID=380 RepID=UPI000560559E|nr:protein-disulfide reductase DsbD domain-containing protein [Sinorhizobium fredii]